MWLVDDGSTGASPPSVAPGPPPTPAFTCSTRPTPGYPPPAMPPWSGPRGQLPPVCGRGRLPALPPLPSGWSPTAGATGADLVIGRFRADAGTRKRPSGATSAGTGCSPAGNSRRRCSRPRPTSTRRAMEQSSTDAPLWRGGRLRCDPE